MHIPHQTASVSDPARQGLHLDIRINDLHIIRHGQCSPEGSLSAQGRNTMDLLVRYFQNLEIDPSLTRIICSNKLRALKSAGHLTGALGLDDAQGFPELYSDDRQMDIEAALRLMRHKMRTCLSVIVITHYEMVSALAEAVAPIMLTESVRSPGLQNDPGTGYRLNRVSGTFTRVIP